MALFMEVIVNFHSWPQDQIYEVFGKPFTDPVVFISEHTQSVYSASAPSYFVEPIDFSTFDPKYLNPDIQIIDLGQSFYLNAPPPDGLGTPMTYFAPELTFDQAASAHSDMWALCCSLFEIRSGEPLFEVFFGNKEGIVPQMVNIFGKLPEPWWSAWKGEGGNANEAGIYALRERIIEAIGRNPETGKAPTHNKNLDTIWSEYPEISAGEVDFMKDFLEEL